MMMSCGSSDSSAGLASTSFKVFGNCSMCEKTIEGSLKGVEGMSKADWNKESKEIEVVYDSTKINLEEIKSKIAAVGYDMENVRAMDTTYAELPKCCQYNRPD